jgi:hypothetical protein
MIDVSSFLIERQRLRRFCFRHTTAVVVIRDIAGGMEDPRSNPATRISEWLLFSLTIDAVRFADPDDGCDDFSPSVFAVPNVPVMKRDVAAALDAHRGSMPFIVDYRVGEVIWSLLSSRTTAGTLSQIKLWDRGLRQRRRLGGLITSDVAADGIAILCDGSSVLRRSDGETLDIGAGFWRAASGEIASQRCVQRDQWQRSAFDVKGNA